MSPQRNLSNFIDTLLLSYVLSEETIVCQIEKKIIDDYKLLNKKCDDVISKIKKRKNANIKK